MHIVDGALSNPVLIGGGLLAASGVAYSLKKLEPEDLPRVGVLSAVFFVASLIHVPLGFSSVHLILNGLLGIILGWAAFPALAVALLLQAVFFGFGGLTVLGVNAVNIAFPAVLVYYLCRWGLSAEKHLLAKRVADGLFGVFFLLTIWAGFALYQLYQIEGGSWSVTVNSVSLILFAVVMAYGYFLYRRGTLSVAGFWGFLGGSLSIFLTAVMVAISLALSGEEFGKAAEFVIVAHFPVMAVEGLLTAATIQLITKVKPELLHAVR
ncbi:cobalt transporter CbiM [Kiloniella laminariae]|uniref:cobalt transporter CbiM n=1 Tax=Kiloniella laminariae TaxID=454162 RepID=UPI00036ED642|nr:cobalt transporter CbiM [Kiloniella laminariae]